MKFPHLLQLLVVKAKELSLKLQPKFRVTANGYQVLFQRLNVCIEFKSNHLMQQSQQFNNPVIALTEHLLVLKSYKRVSLKISMLTTP